MLVLNLPFKALMFLTLMRPSLVLFLVLWLKLVKDFLKVRCRLALLPFLISCLILRQMLTQAQTAGQYFTNDQIKEMTRKVSAEVDLVHQQTQNQRYGSSHIGATAKDISNVV